MICPKCSHSETKIVDSRETNNGRTWRRRECLNCKHRFTTYEIVENVPVMVVKKDKSRQEFDKTKVLNGLLTALKKRPVSSDVIDNLINQIENMVMNLKSKEIKSKDLGEFIMGELKRIDEVAYIRYASVYKDFSKTSEFIDAVKGIDKEGKEEDSMDTTNKADTVFQVAIDGPAGTGKSTVAKEIAIKLKIDYLNTGAIYRAFAYKIIQTGTDKKDKSSLMKLLNETEFDFKNNNVYLDGKKLGDKIRTEEISKLASDISALGFVRQNLVKCQRDIGSKKSVVAEGRDIGTNVFKDAKYKFFMTAEPEIRAKRRVKQLEEAGEKGDYDTILEDIKIRDHNDSNRKINPLAQAPDAILIDTSKMNIKEVVGKILSYIN